LWHLTPQFLLAEEKKIFVLKIKRKKKGNTIFPIPSATKHDPFLFLFIERKFKV